MELKGSFQKSSLEALGPGTVRWRWLGRAVAKSVRSIVSRVLIWELAVLGVRWEEEERSDRFVEVGVRREGFRGGGEGGGVGDGSVVGLE